MPKHKFFIDSDAGTDDAVALIMAFRHPAVDVVGISAVGGNVPLDKVVQNIGYVCSLCEAQVPFYSGSAKPLIKELTPADFIHGQDGLGDIGLDLTGRNPYPGNGVHQIISTFKNQPDAIDLICLGPLTNIARAIIKEPHVLSWVRRIVIMGGLIRLPGNVTPMAEFNIWADPDAADIVFRSITSLTVPCTMIGWDSTLASSDLSLGELKDLAALSTPLSHFATAIQAPRMKWMREQNMTVTINLADVLAMAVAINNDIITDSDRYEMQVDTGLKDENLRGYITATPARGHHGIDFIHKVDRDQYLQMLKQCLQSNIDS